MCPGPLTMLLSIHMFVKLNCVSFVDGVVSISHWDSCMRLSGNYASKSPLIACDDVYRTNDEGKFCLCYQPLNSLAKLH